MSEKPFRLMENLHLSRAQESISYDVNLEANEDSALAGRPDYFTKSHCHMLIDDLALGIMPIQAGLDTDAFSVRLEPSNRHVEALIIDALRGGHHGPDLSYPVGEFFRETCQRMLAFGEAYYEVVCASENDQNPERGPALGLRFVRVPHGTVSLRKGKYTQYLPETVAKRLKLPQRIEFTAGRIIVFRLPVDSRKTIAEIMEQLSFRSDNLAPAFALSQRDVSERQVPYDQAVYHRTEKLALAESTKAIGYNSRQFFNDQMTEYYMLHRELAFMRLKIETRNSIQETFNEMLGRAGKELGFSAYLHIEGLPELADVETAESELSEGTKSFSEIMKLCI